jgi:carboxymethylenebutenolidase
VTDIELIQYEAIGGDDPMGTKIDLTAADGHQFSAWKAQPAGAAKAGLVVIQEIFGVNAHIREVTEGFAKQGYLAIAPAMFDRAERGVELGYVDSDVTRGRELRAKMDWDVALLDIAAAVQEAGSVGKVGIVGFCWGGSLSWLAACRMSIAASVSYYGAQIIDFVKETPRCPVLLQFGAEDATIPPATVETIRKAHPNIETLIWPAPHGFNCDHRGAYRKDSADKAMERTLSFLASHLR